MKSIDIKLIVPDNTDSNVVLCSVICGIEDFDLSKECDKELKLSGELVKNSKDILIIFKER